MPKYQDRATRVTKNESNLPKALRPAVMRQPTLKETRFLLSIIENNVSGVKDGYFWDFIAVDAGLRFPSSDLAYDTFQRLKTSLSIAPAPTPEPGLHSPPDNLQLARLEVLDGMIADAEQKVGEMRREREVKREMKAEEEELKTEEQRLREKRETLRCRTEERLKRKREGVWKEESDGEDRKVKVKKEKRIKRKRDGVWKAEEEEEEEEDRKVKKEKIEVDSDGEEV